MMLEVILGGTLLGSIAFIAVLLTLPSRFEGQVSEEVNHATSKPEDDGPGKTSVQVLVLGDIGRSPRMQYHAMSIARHGGRVDLIGYQESDPHPNLVSDSLISIVPLQTSPRLSQRLPFIISGPVKVLWQIWNLWLVLGYRTKPARWMLVQNPPSIPSLVIAQIVCFLRNTKLIIDWHNFGWSILAMKLGNDHPLVKASKWYERFFGRFGTANFTVSAAMARALKEEYGVRSPIFALHDRPPSHFQSLSPQERSAFLGRLPMTTSHLSAILEGDMRLIVSSTSWTFDEDFSLLLDALVSYSEEAGQDDCALPTILAVITGKGPQRAHYQQAIAKLQSERKLVNVTIVTAWLSMEDYASLLGSADLGVSLHTSSSGLDLPMKVVDMFGAGLPVVGWGKFEAWSELVKEGENGRGFSDAAQLKDVLVELLGASSTALAHLKQGAIREGQRRWEDEWKPVAGRLLGVCD